MFVYAIASLAPIFLIAAASLLGGTWAHLVFIYMAIFVAVIDRIVSKVRPASMGEEFPAATALMVTLAFAHFCGLSLAIDALASDRFTLLQKASIFIGAGLWFGQVSNSNAHELIHRQNRLLRGLGKWIYISLLFGHHTSAHVLVHHVHVASDADPNSARLGESFYRFFIRAWKGSFIKSLKIETARMRQSGRNLASHPFVAYIGGAIGFMALSALLFGVPGLIAYCALAFHAQSQLLLSDYVQHYGLRRRVDETGRLEPVSAAHSWNAPKWYSSAMMLNAPRHSDHHLRPMAPFPTLELPDAPTLPRSLPVMATVALFPALWRRVMNRRVAIWTK